MDLLQVIKREIRITEYAQAHGFTPVRVGSLYTLKEHDSVRIDPEKNLFIRNSDRKTSGSIIDFAMWINNQSRDEAIRGLRGMLTRGEEYVPRPEVAHMATAPPKELTLPPPTEGQYRRTYAYLNKTRCIDNSIISEMVKRKLLYEDDRHNCVFVGHDYDGKAAFATKRSTSTNSDYRGDAAGSRKEVGFFVDNKAPALFVTESPIDAMSVMGMLKANDRDPHEYSYLALCGVSDRALKYHMGKDENSGIRKVYMATDNDAPGNTARGDLRHSLENAGFKGKIIDKVPTQKDWNDDLVKLLHPERELNQTATAAPAQKQINQLKFEGSIQV